jgi:hypothetical protein
LQRERPLGLASGSDDRFFDVHGFKTFRCCARPLERYKMPLYSQLLVGYEVRARYIVRTLSP